MAAIPITRVRGANERLTRTSGHVALFIGATNGIGASTFHSFLKYFNAPKVYVVGRLKTKAAAQLATLQELNSAATIIFLENEISLIKNVDTVCAQIKEKEQHLDLLYMSAGYLAFGEPQYTSEGIDTCFALSYYIRMRLAQNLLPLISRSPRGGRIVSVLSGGEERGLIKNDLGLKNNYNVINVANQSTTLHTLAFEYLAKQYPNVSFIHVYPGWVKTDIFLNLFHSSSGCLLTLARWTLVPLFGLIATSVEDSGERQVYHATDPKYEAPGASGRNSHRVGAKSDIVVDDRVLGPLRAEGWREKVWEHTESVWAEALRVRMDVERKIY
ncbi:NAD(P)-binding protein [Lentithecium fluviatile CBS 122367]|uniref:NAD(P)-binding protein n=1 Tax=Lentithecium fluviatile CBS 122367 TaxID=1168545 RepID=A0A6G1J7J8_9PLEO|nr:NAD(P)-binding protein [Lentithecium fluviatile CBS 122367]